MEGMGTGWGRAWIAWALTSSAWTWSWTTWFLALSAWLIHQPCGPPRPGVHGLEHMGPVLDHMATTLEQVDTNNLECMGLEPMGPNDLECMGLEHMGANHGEFVEQEHVGANSL